MMTEVQGCTHSSSPETLLILVSTNNPYYRLFLDFLLSFVLAYLYSTSVHVM